MALKLSQHSSSPAAAVIQPRPIRASRTAISGRIVFGLTLAISLLAAAGYLVTGGESDPEALVRAGRLILLADRPENGLALGFDRAPIPSLLMAFWLPLPGLAFGLVAGTLGSATALGAAAVWVRSIVSGLGLTGSRRIVLLLAVIANPVVVAATISGSPEVAVFAAQTGLLLAISVWLRRDTPGGLMVVGFAGGLAILTDSRFVVLVLVLLVMVIVRGVTASLRRPGADAIGVALPILFVLGLWSIICLIATGSPFQWVEQTAARLSVTEGFAGAADLAAFGALLAARLNGPRRGVVLALLATTLVTTVCVFGLVSRSSVIALVLPLAVCLIGIGETIPGRIRSTFSAALSIVIVVGVPIAVERSVSPFELRDRSGGQARTIADLRAAARLLDTATAPRRSLVDGDLGDIVVAFAHRPDRYLTPRDPEFNAVNGAVEGSVELLLIGTDDGPIARRHPDAKRRSVDWARVELDRPGLRVLRLNEPVRSVR